MVVVVVVEVVVVAVVVVAVVVVAVVVVVVHTKRAHERACKAECRCKHQNVHGTVARTRFAPHAHLVEICLMERCRSPGYDVRSVRITQRLGDPKGASRRGESPEPEPGTTR